jgi:predicted dithiol-disulfide oxidoreductase (DUF899 family)
MTTQSQTRLPNVASQAEWLAASKQLLAKEKQLTRQHDQLAAERRKVSLTDLFDGRRQLIVYHFMFAPGVEGWPTAGCSGCSMFVDQIGHSAHLHARDVSFALVSRAPLSRIQPYQKRMGWALPWYSSSESDFNDDFGVTTPKGETFGLSVFLRDGDSVYRTYFTNGRGVEALGPVWTFLDLTPYGRQEDWEDSPDGYPQTPPYQWWRRHDEYEGVKNREDG